MTSAADDEQRPRMASAASRFAFFPARAAARASRDRLGAAADDVLVPELARLIDRALAGSLPEDIARSIGKHRVLERVVAELAASGDLDQALEDALASPRTSKLMDQLMDSDEVRGALKEVVASPEVRAAIMQQTTGLGEELVVGVRGRAVAMDDRAELAVHRKPLAARAPFAGLATRAAAFAVDSALILATYVLLAAAAGLAATLFGGFRPGWLVSTLLAGGWVLLAGGYFVLFWSGAGQTLGMRLFHLRVRGHTGSPPSFWRSILRVVGMVLSIIPFFAGYVPVLFDERRRGVPDYLAGTEVVYDDA